MAIWPASYVSNRLWNLHVSYGDEKLASYRACVESKARTRDSLYIFLIHGISQIVRKLKSETLALGDCVVWNLAALHYDKTNDKSTVPISKGFKEKKLKAPNAETAFVSDF